jgi:hypothetical protein
MKGTSGTSTLVETSCQEVQKYLKIFSRIS